MNNKVNNILTIISFIVTMVIIIYYVFSLDIFRNKPKLEDTSLILKSAKGILEFISVEYYGEAVASFETTSEANFYDYRDKQIKPLFEYIKEELNNYEEKRPGRSGKIARMNLFKAENVSLKNDDKYYQIIDATKKNKERNALDYIRRKSWDNDFMKNYNRYYYNQKKKEKIAYVGRGWVQAGFNFKSLKKENIVLDESLKSISIKGVTPEIIDCIINPWLIPNEIKGYEIIFSEGGDIDNAQIQQTKESCKDSLLNDALIKGKILLKAKETAEEFLPPFLSILLSKEIETVKFEVSDNDLWFKSIAYDGFLNLSEINGIEEHYNDSLVPQNEKDEFKTDFLPRIKNLKRTKTAENRTILIN